MTRLNALISAVLVVAQSAISLASARADSAPIGTFGKIDDVRLKDAAAEPQNWLSHGGAFPEWYYSPLGAVNQSNVAQLKPAWVFEFDTVRGQQATPIVVDGVIYTTSAWSKVYALDAMTGRKIWSYDPKVSGQDAAKACCDVVNRGVAVYMGKVYVAALDGRLIALDAKTGTVVWSVMTVDLTHTYSISSAPRVLPGKIVIGNSGGEMGVRGYVTAYDAQTGRLAWRFYTVPNNSTQGPDGAASDEVIAKVARPTWFGKRAKFGAGGAVWNAMVYDPELNLLYMGTGNPFPWNRKTRSEGRGDNLFASSIVALNANTGKYIWHYQENPGDSWDFDAVADMALTDLTIGGQTCKVLMQAAKNGFFYVIDRRTGKLISADPYVEGIRWAKKIDLMTGRPVVALNAYYDHKPFAGSPGPVGAHSWVSSAYSPKTGLVYVASSQNGLTYANEDNYKFVEGLVNVGIRKDDLAGIHAAGPASRDYLVAWDPSSVKAAWRVPSHGGGGTLATGGNLVFQGEHRKVTAGRLVAYRADTGEPVWSIDTPNTIMAGPISYEVDGEQYIAATGGAGGADIVGATTNETLASQPGRLIAFKLGGTAQMPPDPPPAPPANPPSQQWPESTIAAGAAAYAEYCTGCHGMNTQSSNIVPDLRRSAALTNYDAWQSIVIGGVLTDQGMISWKRFLNAARAERIRAYVGREARKLAAEQH
jgi:quinohemoprotein ethanol dehydrogenase